MNEQDLKTRIQNLEGLRGLAQRTTMDAFCESLKREPGEHVDHPRHYRADSGYEVIDLIEEWNLGFHLGNALKYIARAGLKDPKKAREDLDKAIWYIERYQENYLTEETEEDEQ